MTRAPVLLLVCTLAALGGCSAHSGGQPPDGAAGDAGSGTRDWAADPAIYVGAPAGALYAVSDVHGGDERIAKLLHAAHLVDGAGSEATWTGGDATLVVVGDSIDKGAGSVRVLDLWRALEPQARQAGGRLVVLLGNHEAEFLADPENKKADALQAELDALGETPEHFASADSPYGRFLRRLPVAALVGGWFFAHAGSSGALTVDELSLRFRQAVEAGRWDDAFLAGDDSLLEANDWWSDAVLTRDLAALGARHVAMGHDPHAFGEEGKIRAHLGGKLVRLDTGLSPAVDYSKGLLLRVDHAGGPDEAAMTIDPSGKVSAVNLAAP